MDKHSKRKKKKNILRRTIFTLLGLIFCAVVVISLYTYSLLSRIKEKPLAESPEDLGISSTAPNEKDTGVINILLFGVDRRTQDEASRSDSIMIATMDKKNKTVKLTSLMRDMYVAIPGKQDNRINAAYAFGGPALAIKTVNQNFNLDIQRYATVDFFALEKVVDKLGGVPIDVKKEELAKLNEHLNELNQLDKESPKSPRVEKAGLQILDGKQTVAYSRIRYVGNGDYERTERQRMVLDQIFKKAKTAGIVNLPGLVSTVLPYVETNMTKTEIMSFGMTIMGFGTKDTQQYRLPVDGTFKNQRVRGMAVLVPDIEKNTKLLHEFLYN